MVKHYVILGHQHTHSINNNTLDCDSVVCYEAENAEQGRKRAFELFGYKFFTDYHDKQFKMEDLCYYPRGIINID